MNSRASWSVDAIEPSVRERAEAAARGAGMSLNDWINSTLGSVSPPNSGVPNASVPNTSVSLAPAQANEQSRDVADIHQRLDSITRQIEQISRPAPRSDISREPGGVARQLNDAISRLDARLSQISSPPVPRQAQQPEQPLPPKAAEYSAARFYSNSPPLSPTSLDIAVAEITARQNELDSFWPASRSTPAAPPVTPPAPPPAQGADFSSLERHLTKITSQIESLRQPDNIEQSIAAFRSELAEIRHAITEAMPRRAIESIENEIGTLHRRIDENRNSGIDGQALAGIEHALGEIREVLGSLTPAEQLAGFDDAIRNLGTKLDRILRANDDPGTVQQFEGAIAALRAIVSNVASNDALARLSEDVHQLSSKVDQITSAVDNGGNFAILEQRIAALTTALENRERPVAAANTDNLETALHALAERFDRMEIGKDGASTLAHLEQRVSYLLERVEAFADRDRDVDMRRVEEGLHDVLRQLEKQQASVSMLAESRPPAGSIDPGLLDMVKRELTDIRSSQTESNRHTKDSLEAVNGTLGNVVNRLSTIESDLRTVRRTPAQPSATLSAMDAQAAIPPQPRPESLRPELPNPAAAQGAFAAVARDFHAEQAAPPIAPAMPVSPRAISDILGPQAAAARASNPPELPPDHPLEPGTWTGVRSATPAERIAASESAISEIPTAPREPMSSSSFIAAARRAAQTAAAAQPEKTGRGAAKSGATKEKGKIGSILNSSLASAKTLSPRTRTLLISASVVAILVGGFLLGMRLFGGDHAPPPMPMPPMESQSEAPQATPPIGTGTPVNTTAPVNNGTRSAAPSAPQQITPSMTSPTPLGKQSFNTIAPTGNDGDTSAAMPEPLTVAAASADGSEVTDAVPTSSVALRNNLSVTRAQSGEHLPDGIGGTALRTAAIKGDANAAYEVGMRFAEAKGVPANFEAAAKWYDRAAQAGVVPAIFRLGTLYEKGLGVKKDAEIARRYYLQAAERGNAKAMHNLAVLEADGGNKGANYKSAAQWFRKAADRGVADSQFNLGVLYARGIGVEQNLAESFKWFSLAAAQGDTDAATKRDDVAKRLDTQSLAAAKLAIQTFTPEPQPQDAVNVPTPAGGWDGAVPQANSTKPVAKPGLVKRASR